MTVGMFADRAGDLALDLPALPLTVLIVPTRLSTICRRVLSSSSPTRARGGRPSTSARKDAVSGRKAPRWF
jgi:hypothetical protein